MVEMDFLCSNPVKTIFLTGSEQCSVWFYNRRLNYLKKRDKKSPWTKMLSLRDVLACYHPSSRPKEAAFKYAPPGRSYTRARYRAPPAGSLLELASRMTQRPCSPGPLQRFSVTAPLWKKIWPATYLFFVNVFSFFNHNIITIATCQPFAKKIIQAG